MSDPAALVAEAVRIVVDAGSLLLTLNPTRIVSNTAGKGLLLEADLAIDTFIVAALAESFPEHAVVTEERANHASAARSVWILDPICGTLNYARGIPYYAIGLSHWDAGEPRVAVVYNPVSGELFRAVAGEGAWLGQERLHVSSVARLEGSVVCFNTNMSSPVGQRQAGQLFECLRPPRTERLRLTESANLDLAYVAAARYDAYVHPTDNVWDVAAGCLLVREAGGRISRFAGRPVFTLDGLGVVASNPLVFDELISAVRPVMAAE